MSLFGTSPDESGAASTPAKSRQTLFDDPSPANGSQSSLFADDDSTPGGSPWGMPTPKKASKGEVISTLLSGGDAPDSYVDVFESVQSKEFGQSGTVDVAGMTRVMNAAKLGADQQTRVMNTIAPAGNTLRRNEFNVFLALVGLAQEGDDITLDGVDERRKKLPQPDLHNLSTAPEGLPDTSELASKPPQRPATPPTKSIPTPKSRETRPRRESLIEDDPWGSPALHKGHNHGVPQPAPAPRHVESTATRTNGSFEPSERTTSNFTTESVIESTNGSRESARESRPAPNSLWYSYDGNSPNSYGSGLPTGLEQNAFAGGLGDDPHRPPVNQHRAIGSGGLTGNGVEENILVTLLPEKEGVFLFQHHNYQVHSPRRGSKVVRRYSDFVWLLDCLHKRYPFRRLPLLPPKRVGVNGSYLAADSTFIEKRRRGLVRFVNALVKHPVLNQEQLVVMLLTVPTELAVWRKQATISVQEEFTGKALLPGLEDSLPPTLNELFETTRSGVRKSAEVYINLCTLMDRLAKRNEGLAADHGRLSTSLMSLTDASHATYAIDTNDVPLLNEGLLTTAKHVTDSQSLLQDEARAWDEGVLEDLKKQRDALVSMREMFDRRERYDKDNIPQLEKRIKSNEEKLANLRSRPEGVKPGDVERTTESILKDKESIVAQHARGVFVKECLRDELTYFQDSQYQVSRWNQDWAQERVKYSELQADNWRQLNDQLESMPIGG
ncbi:hypothetical protein V499_04047 [Pseudogymnoascus sp. VKM F-103]|nr:hypothetical protein V499_04047 [Pseudogymnoascus sp. VKM F-103]